ncbi:MAG: amino acid adenylation domain-containing protein, partial [Acidobacteriota bacterium]
EGSTLFMVLLAGFQALLGRWSGQEDVAVGSPIAGRHHLEIEGLIGFFVNTLVLRGDLSGEPSFREVLGRVREATLAAHLHQDVPFEKLVEELEPERSLSYTPLFQVMLIVQNEEEQPALGEELRPRGLAEGGTATSKFDLTLSLAESDGVLTGGLTFATDLFDGVTIDRMLRHLEHLLAAAVAEPERPSGPGRSVWELPLLGAAERSQLLVEWNDTGSQALAGTLLERLARRVERSPDAVAVVDRAGSLSFAALDRRGTGLAHRLRTLGAGPEERVGVAYPPSRQAAVAVLGVVKTGAAFVPLDPSHPEARLRGLIEDAGVRTVVTGPELAARLEAWGVRTVDAEPWARAASPGERGATPSPEAGTLAYVLYTSGSTGAPKGVMIEHRSLLRYLRSVDRDLFGDGLRRLPMITRPSFDAFLKQLLVPLLRGEPVWIPDPGLVERPAALLAALGARPGSGLNCVPSLWRALLEEVEEGRAAPPAGLRLLLGGEALDRDLVERSRAAFPGVRIWNLYGPTEATANATWCEVRGGPRGGRSGRVSIGRPIAGVRTYVVDRLLGPAPVGVAGELVIGGAGLARGYLGLPARTAERFVPDPFSGEPGARLYRSGDLARWLPGGELEFLGRVDHQVKVRGFRIELGEIEAVLGRLPGVREAAVVARSEEQPVRAKGAKGAAGAKTGLRLVAYVAGEDAPVDPKTVRERLRELLPDYMVPAVTVPLDALPKTPGGKVDRRALPAPDMETVTETFVAPRTPVEEVLAGIWSEVLGVDPVGTGDDFFALGGHSLLATRVTSRLRPAFGVELPVRVLFEAPTVARLAARVEEAIRAGSDLVAPPLRPIDRPGDRERGLPLSFAQQRLWFIDQLEPGSPVYNIPVSVRLEGPLEVAVLARSLDAVIRRHEALRTVFVAEGGEPRQVVLPPADLGLPVVDLGGLPEAGREREMERLGEEEAARPFDLERGPMLRASVVRLGSPGDRGPEDHAVLLTMHHIASDGWSMGILMRELRALYRAFGAATGSDAPSPLAELPVQYGDYAVWQRSWLRGEVLEREIGYWREQLAGLPPVLELPADRPRPAVQSSRGAFRPLSLSPEVSDGLRASARSERATLFMVLLAGFQALLGRISGQEDLAVGTPIAGRNHLEIEGLIGFFVNTLVLRGDLSGEPSFRELVGRVREASLAAHLHQDVPFEKLVEELEPERSLSYTPLFQVMFMVVEEERQAGLSDELRPRRSPGAGTTTAKFDLTLSLADRAGGLSGGVVYGTDLFDGVSVERMIHHFGRLLEGALAEPDRPLRELPLLAAAEWTQVVVEWNDTGAPGAGRTLLERFSRQVRSRPDRVALVCGRTWLSFAALDRRATRLARRLRARGVGAESRVALVLGRSVELIVGLLGVAKAGGCFVALDPAQPAIRLERALADAAPAVVLGQAEIAAMTGAPDG